MTLFLAMDLQIPWEHLMLEQHRLTFGFLWVRYRCVTIMFMGMFPITTCGSYFLEFESFTICTNLKFYDIAFIFVFIIYHTSPRWMTVEWYAVKFILRPFKSYGVPSSDGLWLERGWPQSKAEWNVWLGEGSNRWKGFDLWRFSVSGRCGYIRCTCIKITNNSQFFWL